MTPMTPAERAAIDQLKAVTADGLAAFGVDHGNPVAMKAALAIVEVILIIFEGAPALDRDLVVQGHRFVLQEMQPGSIERTP